MEGNVLQLVRQRPPPHTYPALMDLSNCIKPTVNYTPKLTSRVMKNHYFGVVTAPSFTNDPNGSLIPLSVIVNGGETTTKMPSMVACTEEQKPEIERKILWP